MLRDSLAINLRHCLTVVPLARLRTDVVARTCFFAVWEELEARDQPKTGNKAWLRRRLHGAIVRAHLAERETESHR